jgi:hypothetical protein
MASLGERDFFTDAPLALLEEARRFDYEPIYMLRSPSALHIEFPAA